MTKGKRGLKPKIIEMFLAGYKPPAIANRLGCSRTNVWRVLHRKGISKKGTGWNGYIGSLPPKIVAWMEREAKRTKASTATLAAALLVDAVELAIEESADLRMRTSVGKMREGFTTHRVMG